MRLVAGAATDPRSPIGLAPRAGEHFRYTTAGLEVTSRSTDLNGSDRRDRREQETLVVRNGTLIDGSGKLSARIEAIVIEGNWIKSVGALPPECRWRTAGRWR